jgi:hypothetical protein
MAAQFLDQLLKLRQPFAAPALFLDIEGDAGAFPHAEIHKGAFDGMGCLAEEQRVFLAQGLFKCTHVLAEGVDKARQECVDLLKRQVEMGGKMLADSLDLLLWCQSALPIGGGGLFLKN